MDLQSLWQNTTLQSTECLKRYTGRRNLSEGNTCLSMGPTPIIMATFQSRMLGFFQELLTDIIGFSVYGAPFSGITTDFYFHLKENYFTTYHDAFI